MTLEQFRDQEEQQDFRFAEFLACETLSEQKDRHKLIYADYHKEVAKNWEKEYKEQKGWGIVKPVIDMKKIAPLCKYPFRRSNLTGCDFCKKKRYWYDVIDPDQEVYAIYFSMNLVPLWTKLRKRWPNWTTAQVQNNRYWRATKHKLLKEMELEFLKANPGPWCRALNRGTGYQHPKTGEWIHQPHTTYTFGIWYSRTMEQIDIYMRWPPEPHPLTIQFVGRPKPGFDHSHDPFILSEETVGKKTVRRPKAIEQYTEEEHIDIVEMAQGLNLADFEHLL